MAQDFGRRQPVVFMGAAALLGFAASRFLMASAQRARPAPSYTSEDDYGTSGVGSSYTGETTSPSYTGGSTRSSYSAGPQRVARTPVERQGRPMPAVRPALHIRAGQPRAGLAAAYRRAPPPAMGTSNGWFRRTKFDHRSDWKSRLRYFEPFPQRKSNSQKLRQPKRSREVVTAGRNVAIGGVLAIGAVGVFLAALVAGLTAILVALGMYEPLANFVSALVITIIIGAVAYVFISRGIAEFKANKLNMERTTQSLAMDAAAVRESI